MKLLEKLSLVSETYISRDYIKLMSIDSVRKDFELIRIGEIMRGLCKEVEFYSKCSDDLLSIEQCYEFASGEVVNNFLDDVFLGLISDAAMEVAFDTKDISSEDLGFIEINAELIVNLIFLSCDEENDLDRQIVFIKGFDEHFSHLNVPFLEQRRSELKHGVLAHIG